ncbi:hypothetical protein I4F81_001271 [Pyropia yezoensis]|uniref:Uncharacterized protein n=1 Tax=Pyropia yezoensis TaxID=2788 RepID=A0ACC3BL31_PYRYE|nr:hypothetical protein I4F81_001271 [Neopyropia yezoensis]
MPPPIRPAASAAALVATSAANRRAAVGINMPSRAVAAALLSAAPAPVAHKTVLAAVTDDPRYGGLVTSATHFKRVLRAMADAGRLRLTRKGEVIYRRYLGMDPEGEARGGGDAGTDAGVGLAAAVDSPRGAEGEPAGERGA